MIVVCTLNVGCISLTVWARLTDDRVARDDRGMHIECGVYLTKTLTIQEVRFDDPISSEKISALITLM